MIWTTWIAGRAAGAVLCGALVCELLANSASANNYKNFAVAVYIPAAVVQRMKDPQWLQNSWVTVSSQVKIDKVYIETYRSGLVLDEPALEQIKRFFQDKGVRVAGGIALTTNEARQFQSFCYTDPKDREFVKNIVTMTAHHFDEIILDDFFFNMTKYDSDIAAKGDKSWTQFRLDLMDEVAENLILKPAKAANPQVKVIIKFPNWYEHFQGLGYDLDKEPKLFDGIYAGTETRDPVATDQHLQQYESYQVFHYFENIKPGGNGGGWVDTFSVLYVDRYAEQLWDTMFAKAPEITLFNWMALTQPIRPGDRSAWQSVPTSFDYDQMLKSREVPAGSPGPTMARVAGYSLEQVDAFLGQLGKPMGIKSYKPFQSTGEDFLHNYLGMMGIPIDLYPTFPTDTNVVLLTESAKFDPDIVSKIKGQLTAGKSVVITSGLLRALQGKGIEDIVELEYTDHKVAVRDYVAGFGPGGGAVLGGAPNAEIVIPEIRFLTNDAWALVRGVANGTSYPLLLMDRYSKGILYVLTIPENFSDLYNLPPEVVGSIKNFVMRGFPVRLDGPSQVSLFAYDNNTFIVESFLPKAADVTVSVSGGFTKLRDLVRGEVIVGQTSVTSSRDPRRDAGGQASPPVTFSLTLPPHSYRVFAAEK
jgi:hypothetical protein